MVEGRAEHVEIRKEGFGKFVRGGGRIENDVAAMIVVG